MTTTTVPTTSTRLSHHPHRASATAAALAVIVIYGAWAFIYEISNGLGVTDMRNVQVWGLYIIAFMFFVGASAGGMIVASVGTIFHVRAVERLARYAIMTSLATITVAGLVILPDLGQPGRAWHMFVHGHWTSPMIWDIVVVLAYGVFNLAYLWLHMRVDLAARRSWLTLGFNRTDEAALRRDRKLMLGGAYVALPLAFGLHSITAWIISTQPAHPYWFSTVMAPWFVVSAVVSGIALVLAVLAVMERLGRLDIGTDALRWMSGFLAVAVAIELFIIVAEVVTIQAGRVPADRLALSQMTTGSYAWVFWAEIVTAVAALAILLRPGGRRSWPLVVSASGLVLVSTAFMRTQLMLGGLRYPNLGYPPGISLGTHSQLTTIGNSQTGFLPTGSSFVQLGQYNPTWVEWSIVIGLCALWALMLFAAVRFLPMLPGPTAADNPTWEPTAPDGAAHVASADGHDSTPAAIPDPAVTP